MHRRNVLRVSAGIMGILGSTGAALAGQLPDCTIDFEAGCPDGAPICGASFSGGNSCAFEGLEFCYSSGFFSYKITPGFPLTITLSADLIALDVFFVAEGAVSGEMRFFDAEVGGNEVLPPLSTNGDCLLGMPDMQLVGFATPVRRIEVTATGGTIWIDDFRTNPPVCGDGACEGNEDSCNCPQDCPDTCCGDGACEGAEDSCNCSADCPGTCCGDGACEGAEDSCNCSADCPGKCCGDCPTDGPVNGPNGSVGAEDLAYVLGNWGPLPPDADPEIVCIDNLEPLPGNGNIGPEDLAKILGSWGDCPG